MPAITFAPVVVNNIGDLIWQSEDFAREGCERTRIALVGTVARGGGVKEEKNPRWFARARLGIVRVLDKGNGAT